MASLRTVVFKSLVRALRLKHRLRRVVEVVDDPDELRRVLGKWRKWDQSQPPGKLKRRWSHESIDVEGFNLHVLTQTAQRNRRMILYLHGGAYMVGPFRAEWFMMDKIASGTGCDFAVLDYPKAPEHHAPVTIDVVTNAYDFLADTYGASSLILAGTSAGGGLAVALMSDLRDAGRLQPQFAVLLSPFVDLTLSAANADQEHLDILLTSDYVRAAGELYAASLPPDDPRVSPTFGDLSGLAPLFVFAGTDEILLPDIQLFSQRATDAGTEVHLILGQGEQHTWPTVPTPEGRQAVQQIVDIIATNSRPAADPPLRT